MMSTGEARNSSYGCHFEGATRSGLTAENKIFSRRPLETTANEESPGAGMREKHWSVIGLKAMGYIGCKVVIYRLSVFRGNE
jgi:hypothetical protein